MYRYISYSMLVFVAALVAACSSSENMTGDEMAGGANSNAPLSILGTPGDGLVNTGSSYREYTAFINVPGKWSVATSKGLANIYPSEGEGPTTAVVQVGENWGSVRENLLTLTTESTTRRIICLLCSRAILRWIPSRRYSPLIKVLATAICLVANFAAVPWFHCSIFPRLTACSVPRASS